MGPSSEAVYATLLMSDVYLPGAMVLGHSLRDKGAKAKMVVLVTLDTISASTIDELKMIYDEVVPINKIRNPSPANLYVMNRPDLISTFTKIELWRQTQYRQIVYIDADVVALRAPNELLSLDTDFAAVPDIGWPDCFNSGLMVLRPNLGDYYSLLALAQRGISFDGADQGLLNMHFRDWERLSFTYNCTPSGNYQYIPAYRHFQSSISLIHFIGREKPWTLGRENKYSSGVYGELLGMWWTVYDKHYRAPKTTYYTDQYQEPPKKVQDFVKGEETIYLPGPPPSQPVAQPQAPSQATASQPEPQPAGFWGAPPQDTGAEPSSEVPATGVEEPLGDYPKPGELVQREHFRPIPTVEQRRFSAPHAEWEPARAPPPVNSKPEASNFPTQQYDMSTDTQLFVPPARYPEPPKDMWYEVPERVPTPPQPKPIFPWELRAPKATRVFAPPPKPPSPIYVATPQRTREDESGPGPAPEFAPESKRETTSESESRAADVSTTGAEGTAAEKSSTPPIASPDPWQTYQRGNAWDEVPEIERYVQSISQSRKGKLQVLHNTSSKSQPGADRRPSVRLTDFPTEIERPSLPVTPAPIRRPSFWGEERDELGDLPAAEGVPKQEDWNPVAKLEELQRRQSAVLESGAPLEVKEMPKRDMPESANAEAAAAAAEKASAPVKTSPAPKPILKEPKFDTPAEPTPAEPAPATSET